MGEFQQRSMDHQKPEMTSDHLLVSAYPGCLGKRAIQWFSLLMLLPQYYVVNVT